jgi:hypothetical protein
MERQMIPQFIDQSKILPFPKVTPIRLPKVIELLKKHYCYRDNISSLELESEFRKWYSPLVDLEEFPYMYFTNNGITQALEFMSIHYKKHDIKMLVGDYFWLNTIGAASESTKRVECNVSYASTPSAIDGSADGEFTWPSKFHILDGAYIGSSVKKTPVPKNTQIILLGFSKNLGLPELRLGLIFSRVKLPSLDILQKTFGYVGLQAFDIVAKICKTITINELAAELKFHQEQFCKNYTEAEFKPSDSALLATTLDPRFNFYKRSSGIIRIPLGESITKWITV